LDGVVRDGLSAEWSALPKNKTELRFLFIIFWIDESPEETRNCSAGIGIGLREDFSRWMASRWRSLEFRFLISLRFEDFVRRWMTDACRPSIHLLFVKNGCTFSSGPHAYFRCN
jgi:hypothetical protein